MMLCEQVSQASRSGHLFLHCESVASDCHARTCNVVSATSVDPGTQVFGRGIKSRGIHLRRHTPTQEQLQSSPPLAVGTLHHVLEELGGGILRNLRRMLFGHFSFVPLLLRKVLYHISVHCIVSLAVGHQFSSRSDCHSERRTQMPPRLNWTHQRRIVTTHKYIKQRTPQFRSTLCNGMLDQRARRLCFFLLLFLQFYFCQTSRVVHVSAAASFFSRSRDRHDRPAERQNRQADTSEARTAVLSSLLKKER